MYKERDFTDRRQNSNPIILKLLSKYREEIQNKENERRRALKEIGDSL